MAGFSATTAPWPIREHGPNFNQDGRYDLPQVPRLEERAGFFFVNFDHDAPSLNDWLADAGDRLDLLAMHSAAGLEMIRGCHEYEIKANYKLLCENSYDGYHVAATHERFLDYLGKVFEGQEKPTITGKALDLGNGHACFEIRIPTGRPIAQPLPTWSETAIREALAKKEELIARVGPEKAEVIAETNRNMVLFPNSIINDQQTILIRSIIPLAHNRMLVRAWALAPKDESAELRRTRLDGALSFLGPGGFATPDDVEMLELCQIGFENLDTPWQDLSKGFGANEGTESLQDNELQMRAYWTQWDRMMTGGVPAQLAVAAE
jgi:p-cumate 2,3-dioxygenase alpha subunit